MDRAEWPEHADFVDPEAASSYEQHQRRPDVTDCAMARSSLGECELGAAEDESGKRRQRMPADRKTFGKKRIERQGGVPWLGP
jgi:hypothetical protein